MRWICKTSQAKAASLAAVLYYCNDICNTEAMGRPRRTSDPDLASRLRGYLAERRCTLTDVARTIGVDKATVSRAMAEEAFSSDLRTRIAALTRGVQHQETVVDMLQESLRLLASADRLRQDAERLLSQAIDRAARTQ